LGVLPFEVFLTKDISKQQLDYKEMPYLLNNYAISYNYSASVWKNNLAARKRENNAKLLACAAYYPSDDERNLAEKTQVRGSRPLHLFELRNALSPLPAAEEEVKGLSTKFSGQFLTGDAANEQNFRNQAKDYAIIHLAMHGLLNKNTPILSSLAFTENYDSLSDNFLQAQEIALLDLNADLVVLSACETGYGKFEQGEGVMSLARSFMYANVPALVVSLWQVNDGSTAWIMGAFYDNLANGMPKDKALQQAKLDFIQHADGIIAHPAFWSAFIQLGDTQAIELKAKGNQSLIWILGIGGLLLALFLFFFFRNKNTKHVEA